MSEGEGYYMDGAEGDFADIADRNAEQRYEWLHNVEFETQWPIGAPLVPARDSLELPPCHGDGGVQLAAPPPITSV